MKRYAFIDLHIHTVHSYGDGVDITVQKLLDTLNAMAEKENKDVCFSITDHESILGCVEAVKILKSDPERYKHLKFIPGIELNASLKSVGLNANGRSIYSKCHMLGYDYDINDKNLIAYSKIVHKKTDSTIIKKRVLKNIKINTGRQLICAKKYLETIFKTKIPFKIYEDCAHLNSHEEIRNKFLQSSALFLNVSQSEINTIIKDIFYKEPKNNDVADGNSKQDIFDIIDMIKSAGGKVGIAHGNTIKFEQQEIFTDKKHIKTKMEMFDRFIDIVQKSSNNGLDFVELFHNENTIPRAFDKMYEIAEKYDLYITCGSDFHGGILHPNNMLSKCFSKRFEYCSLKGEARERNKYKIKNKVTELAFVDHTFNKGDVKVVKNKRAFRCENIEKGTLTFSQIKSIVNSIDSININEFKKFYKIPKNSVISGQQQNYKKTDDYKYTPPTNSSNILSKMGDYEVYNYYDEQKYKYENHKHKSKFSKKCALNDGVKKKVHKNKYAQFSKVDKEDKEKIDKDEEKTL